MTNPFTPYVGLRGLTADPMPVWVNDLPGLSTELVAAVGKDDQSVAETWTRIGNLALEKLISLIESELSKSGQFQHTVASSTIWNPKTAPAIVGPTSRLQGVRITVPYGSYRRVVIDGFYAQLTTAATLPLSVINLATGGVISTQSIAQGAGSQPFTTVKQIAIDVPMTGLDLFVGVDLGTATVTELGGSARAMTGCSGAAMTTGSLATGNFSPAGFEASDTRIWFAVEVGHSLAAVVSRYAPDLKWAYGYLIGAMLMTDKLASNRINLYTNTNRQYTEELEGKMMVEVRDRLKPLVRRMLSEMNAADTASPVVADADYQAGYYTQSLV